PPAVHPHLAVAHFHRVPRGPDHPLHVVELGILRVREHDDVAAPRRLKSGKAGVSAGNLGAVDRLVDEQEIAREQRPLHAAGRNLKRFDQERADDEEKHQGHAQRAHPIVEPAGQPGAPGRGAEGHWRRARAGTRPRGPQVMHGFYFSHAVPQKQQSPPIRVPPPSGEPGPGTRRGSRHATPGPRSPWPVCFTAPDGRWASAPMVGAFTYVMPVSSSPIARNAAVTSRVYSELESPYFTSLFTPTASSSEPTLITESTGPKISSCSTRIPGRTPASTVGL